MKTCVVLTTINVPVVLKSLVANMERYSRGRDDIEFLIIGDLKTPPTTRPFVENLGDKFLYVGPKEQETWLQDFPDLRDFIPWNSVERRNIGYLMSYEHGADVIISMDDDNEPMGDFDFFGQHSIVGLEVTAPEVQSSSSWFNIGAILEIEPAGTLYMRGFPISKRWQKNTDTQTIMKARVGVNAGLWMGDPDVDTMSRVVAPCRVLSSKCDRLLLSPTTWSPFNSQNTAFSRDLLPCMYLVTFRQGSSILAGNNSFRMDDIWMSYFCQKVMNRIGDRVCYGHPYVTQERNPHDYLTDMRRELPALIMTEKLVEVLRSMQLSSSSYQDGYDELIEKLQESSKGFNNVEMTWLQEMLEGMRLWSGVVKAL